MSSTCATTTPVTPGTPVTPATPATPATPTTTPTTVPQTPATTPTPATVFDSLASLMSLFGLAPCTGSNFKTQSSLETAFGRVYSVDHNSSVSVSVIQRYEAEIARQKKLLEQDKVDRVAAVEVLLAEAAKFNAEHPDDQLDVTLDAPVMYQQYLFLQKKFASRAASASVPVPTSSVSTTAAS